MPQPKKNSSPTDSVAALAAIGGKMPPQAIDFEEVVLGALMLESNALQDVVEILKPEHFYKDAHQRIYAAMLRLNTIMAPIDLLTVANELTKSGELAQVGGKFYLAQLTEKVALAGNIEHHARIIFQKYLQRSLIALGTEMQTSGYDDSKDVADMLEDAENGLFALSQGSMKREVQQVGPVIADVINQMKEASKREDSLSGLASGFHSIDRVTSGWQNATMIVIAARPAMGKTAFVLSMARKMAIAHQTPVAMFSLEMSRVELVKRLMVAESEITMDKIKNGRLTSEEWTHLDNSLVRLNSAPIFIDDTPGLSIFDLRSKCRVLKKKHNIQIVIIDYLQLMTATATKPGNRQEEVSTISRSLKGLSKELDIPIVALSQLNRSVEQRGTPGIDGKRPQLSDLRESGAIEQDADIVCFLHRPEYYHIFEDDSGNSLRGMAQFIIAKHRSGALEDITLRFQAELIRFEEPDEFSYRPQEPQPMTEQTFLQSRMNTMSVDTDAELGSFSNESMPNLTSNDSDRTPF